MPAEPAPTRLDDAASSCAASPRAGAGLTRAQWRRIAAEAELAAKVAESTRSTDLADITLETAEDDDTDTHVTDGEIDAPAADDVPAPVAPAAVADDDIVLTVVDGDAFAGADFVAPESARRRSEPATEAFEVPAAVPGESFGRAAVDDESSASHDDIPEPAPLPDDRVVDEFEFAARLFSFTAQTPVQVAAEAIAEHEAQEVAVPSRGRMRRVAKRMAAASVTAGAVVAVGLLAVGLTSPAVAVFASGDTGRDISATANLAGAGVVDEDEIQAYVSSTPAGVTFERADVFDVTSVAEIAADSGVTNFAGTWVNDPNAAIQWPFPVGVPISAAFGSSSYLSQFSRPHSGTDLTPGAGAEIHAVAAGTVRIATEAGGDYGVTVVIDHVIDGEVVSTRYGHMQYGSLGVEVGDTVQAGQVIGKVGSTGKSTGAHLHLEVLLGGTTQTDPMAWLEEHTAG